MICRLGQLSSRFIAVDVEVRNPTFKVVGEKKRAVWDLESPKPLSEKLWGEPHVAVQIQSVRTISRGLIFKLHLS